VATVKTFVRFLSENGFTNRDYSAVVPPYKRPQPIPSIYSEDEIRKFEAAVRTNRNRRDYAVVLLATRLGIRSGDIARITFDDLDFNNNTIRIVQQKTDTPIELPLLPEIKSAILDYAQNERPNVGGEIIFLVQNPPHNRLSNTLIGKIIQSGILKAGIVSGSRSRGPHAFRSSLASSMVNDNIPYEVVRKTLGHTDPNAIKSYARLDIEQLRVYALSVPEMSGSFADFLCGRSVL
jgi:integrase